MAEKLAPGSWRDGPERPRVRPHADPAEVERLRAKRDSARWSAVVGFALLFGAGFHTGFVVGGVGMIVYGAAASAWWSTRLRKLQGDPWAYDPDLDGPQAPAWAREGRPPTKADVDAHDAHEHDHEGDEPVPGAR